MHDEAARRELPLHVRSLRRIGDVFDDKHRVPVGLGKVQIVDPALDFLGAVRLPIALDAINQIFLADAVDDAAESAKRSSSSPFCGTMRNPGRRRFA